MKVQEKCQVKVLDTEARSYTTKGENLVNRTEHCVTKY